MDGLSACMIDTRIVYGFLGSGKTHYILDCIMNDFFYKYGTTLILCFEQGEETYDTQALLKKNAHAVCYDNQTDIEEFCLDPIRKFHPDRIYVEMNTNIPAIRKRLPDIMNVTYTVTWFDWSTLESDFFNQRQMISQMVSESQQITFRGCPSKELLSPYSQEFKLINNRASYLRQDPMGFHEKAFDLFVPYSLDDDPIIIRSKNYLIFWLDAADHPEHYDGKQLCFPDPLELRHINDEYSWSAGRVVMTCCMSDLQFMSFELLESDPQTIEGGWITMEALGRVVKDEYGRRKLKLDPETVRLSAAPKSAILLSGGPGPGNQSRSMPTSMFQRMSKNRI